MELTIITLILSAILFGLTESSQTENTESKAVSSSSTRDGVDPLVESFSRRICDYFERNPERSEVFNLADIPGSEAGAVFKKIIVQALQNAPGSESSDIAESSGNAVASSFDNFDPANFPMVIGHVYGRSLVKRKLLSEENVACMSRALAGDIWDCFQKVENKDGDGYLMALINACQVFYERLGLSLIEVAPEINEYFVYELTKFMDSKSK